MCICINCRHIHNCTTYYFIEKQHKQLLDLSMKSFTPNQTIINVNLHQNSDKISLDWDLIECLSFVEEPGYWLRKLNSN
uniref:Ycf34 n=1 Tax=Digenea simplex TaxID=945030 RepID=A0A1Z1MTT7_DIGSM|nr:hypothetical protein [Digenea simplex]ARW69503.1 hypothetical protein [Digenea simplex]